MGPAIRAGRKAALVADHPTDAELHELRRRLLEEVGAMAFDCKEKARREIRRVKESPEGQATIAAVKLIRKPARTERDIYEFLIVLAAEGRRKTQEGEGDE